MTDMITGGNTGALLLSVLLVGVAVAVPAAAQEDEEPAPQEVPVTRSIERSVDPETLGVVDDAGGRQGAEDELRDRLAVFGDWFQRSMDIECSGRVPVDRLVEIMDPGRSRPRQMNWVMALDADGDGFVEPVTDLEVALTAPPVWACGCGKPIRRSWHRERRRPGEDRAPLPPYIESLRQRTLKPTYTARPSPGRKAA